MVNNIIFDLGNVLLTFQPHAFLLRFIDDFEYIEQFVNKIFRTQTWMDLDRGTISVEDAKASFISKYPKEKAFLNLFFSHWMEMLTPIEKNIEILKKICDLGYKTYILSNYIKEAYFFTEEKYNIFSLFDGQIISGFEKTIKPEEAIYLKLLTRYHLNPEESLFIDDILFYLKPAKKLGMKTIWNKPETDLREELRKFDILL